MVSNYICYRILVRKQTGVLKLTGVIQKSCCNFVNGKKARFLYMWECVCSRAFWADFVGYLKERCDNCIQLVALILFDHSETVMDICFDFILLQVKFFVYDSQNKQNKTICKKAANHYKTDQCVHRMEMTYYDIFCRKWFPYQVLVE